MKGLQDRLDALKKTPGVGDNAEFAETISEIQASIDAFSSTIEADNKGKYNRQQGLLRNSKQDKHSYR